jgi:hypothetical protein
MTRLWHVKAWIAPKHMVAIAAERTDGMVAAFMSRGARVDQLSTLVRSAYMQGLNDAIDALQQNPVVVREMANEGI